MNSNLDELPIPPIIKQYIQNMMDDGNRMHIRENYRDLLDRVKNVCDEATKAFDKSRQFKQTKTKR